MLIRACRENRESPEMTENEIIFSGPGRAGRPREVSKIFFPNLAKKSPLLASLYQLKGGFISMRLAHTQRLAKCKEGHPEHLETAADRTQDFFAPD